MLITAVISIIRTPNKDKPSKNEYSFVPSFLNKTRTYDIQTRIIVVKTDQIHVLEATVSKTK